VTYNGFSALFSVFVLPLTVAGIEIETPPHKLTYNCGENLDTDGLVICVIYNSGRRNYITQGYSVSYDFGSPGTKSVEVSYLGKTASFEVEVKPVEYEAKFVADGVTVATIRYTGETISIIEPEVPKKQGYVGSWESYELAAGGVTVNAVYTPVEYEAKFVADGITVATIRYTVETISIIEPEVPKKQGYVGSWESYELAAGGITVNAVYSEIKAESVSISSPSKTVRYNQTIALSAQVSPAGFLDNRILWESSDASIASVDENGIVTGISNGTITITATVIDNKGNPVLGSDASPVSDSIELTVTMSFLQKAWRWLGILAQALASIFGF
jgi:hypothetical protein